jgi:hypothetical protein
VENARNEVAQLAEPPAILDAACQSAFHANLVTGPNLAHRQLNPVQEESSG